MNRKTVNQLLALTWLGSVITGFGVQATERETGEVFRDCESCPEMVVVPAGSFMMGSTSEEVAVEGHPEERLLDERPKHQVTIAQPLAISRFEITREEFAAFAEATEFEPAPDCWIRFVDKGEKVVGRTWVDPGTLQTDRHPVICVGWDDAVAYASWLAEHTKKPYRLLTEAEWEYAARAGSNTLRPWGNSPHAGCDYANGPDYSVQEVLTFRIGMACDDGYARTAPVGQFKPNAWGLYDVMGNVWEWVADCYTTNYEGASPIGTPLPDAPGCRRSMRGGSWSETLLNFRTTKRGKGRVDDRGDSIGIRVGYSLPIK